MRRLDDNPIAGEIEGYKYKIIEDKVSSLPKRSVMIKEKDKEGLTVLPMKVINKISHDNNMSYLYESYKDDLYDKLMAKGVEPSDVRVEGFRDYIKDWFGDDFLFMDFDNDMIECMNDYVNDVEKEIEESER